MKPRIFVHILLGTILALQCARAGAQDTTTAWTYGAHDDEMRGTHTPYARIESTNQVDLDFPYKGGSSAEMQVVRFKDGYAVGILLSKGQLACSIDSCALDVKFDQGPVQSIYAKRLSADADTISIAKADKFVADMASSKSMTIELPIFHHGPEQFKFTTVGFHSLSVP